MHFHGVHRVYLFSGMMVVCSGLCAQGPSLAQADSLFFAQNWEKAGEAYGRVLKDTSQNALAWNRLGFVSFNLGDQASAMKYFQKALELKPSPAVQASVYSRMARIHALQHRDPLAISEIAHAIQAGYMNIPELDTLTDFAGLRKDTAFQGMRNRLHQAIYPCLTDAHAREFDFWIGDWDVYVTGTNTFAGHSTIQMISGGCALLENWKSAISEGKSINFVDPMTKKWKQTWAGSYAGGIEEFTNGEYRDGAMRFVFESPGPHGQKDMGRFTFYNVRPGQVRQVKETSHDGGITFTTDYDFTYIRKK